jgi:hypothetical protein
MKIEMKPKYNEKKATQAAVLLLKINQGPINYMKLVKLLYNIDREALKRWARPVTFDDFYSMPHGLIVSMTLDKAETENPVSKTYWDTFIQTKGYDNCLIEDCGDDELSPIEENLIEEIYRKYKDKSQFDMGNEHHNPDLFPEYIDPKGSSIELYYEQVLQKLGFDDDDIAEVMNEMKELSLMQTAFA